MSHLLPNVEKSFYDTPMAWEVQDQPAKSASNSTKGQVVNSNVGSNQRDREKKTSSAKKILPISDKGKDRRKGKERPFVTGNGWQGSKSGNNGYKRDSHEEIGQKPIASLSNINTAFSKRSPEIPADATKSVFSRLGQKPCSSNINNISYFVSEPHQKGKRILKIEKKETFSHKPLGGAGVNRRPTSDPVSLSVKQEQEQEQDQSKASNDAIKPQEPSTPKRVVTASEVLQNSTGSWDQIDDVSPILTAIAWK